MPERRFDDDEVAAIFDLASRSEHPAVSAPAESNGLTLSALQEIGREAGISAEAIARAAQALEQRPQLLSRRLMGLPIGVGRVVEFERPLSDTDWEEFVADLRSTFNARGVVRYDGPFRQWTNGNLQALLEPTRSGHRLRLQTVKGDARSMMSAGSLVVVGAAAFFIATFLMRGEVDLGTLTGITVVGMMGGGLFTAGALRVSGWARRRGEQFDALIARLRDAMRGSSGPGPNT